MQDIFGEGDLAKVYEGVLNAVAEIATVMRYSNSNHAESINAFGEEQLEMDIQTDSIIFECLQKTGVVHHGLSEERPYPTMLGGDKYIVTFDPLDGSSITEANFSVGSIFAIWPNKELIGMKGKEMVGAAVGLYGPRTTVIFYNHITKQVDEIALKSDGKEQKWVVTNRNMTLGPVSTIFAPGNLKATLDHEGYKKAVKYWVDNGYTLRYSGGMAPDCYHMFVKGNGIFSYMGSKKSPAKLRYLYECAPFGFLCEAAGGASTDGNQSILEVAVEGWEQRTAITCGSKEEVARVEKFYKEAGGAPQ